MTTISTTEYIKSRGIELLPAEEKELSEKASSDEYKLLSLKGRDYMVSHFLDDTEKSGYGIIPTNMILKTETINAIAIALVEGDDVICINISDGSIVLWLVQTGIGEKLHIANDLREFLSII